MNFKKTWKRFWTLSRSSEGFTLVELIVVIAILAILAGVAVPAYSGYIKKANKASDLQLLSAVNTAFAAACLESGHDVSDVAAANVTTSTTSPAAVATFARTRAASDETGWYVTGAVVAFTDGSNTADFNDSFKRYYGENNTAKFKVITSLAWDPETGSFGDVADITAKGGSVSYVLNGSAITVSAAAVTTLQNSTFGTEMGGAALMSEITGLTNMMGSGSSKLAEELLADEDYMEAYAAYLGIDASQYATTDALNEAIGEKIVATAVANGADLETMDIESTINSAMVNGMVLYAANGMKDYTVESATSLLTSDNIYSSLSSDSSTRLAEASLVYGMYAGFVNSEYNTNGATSSTDDPMSAIKAISDKTSDDGANFQAYLASDQGKADIEAYMEAMNVVNSASGNEAAASVLVNGFSNSELESLLTQVLGK